VPFFGPNNYTKYEVYSPFVPTGYPYSLNLNNYLPYVFNDGAWLLIGPFQRPYSFNYTTIVTLLPLTPGQHQYSVVTALAWRALGYDKQLHACRSPAYTAHKAP